MSVRLRLTYKGDTTVSFVTAPDAVSPEVKFELGTEIYHIALKMRHAGPAPVCITASGILGKEVFPRLTDICLKINSFYRHTRIEDVARHNTSHGSQMSKRLAVGIAQIKASAYAAAQFHPVNVILCLALPRETQPQEKQYYQNFLHPRCIYF